MGNIELRMELYATTLKFDMVDEIGRDGGIDRLARLRVWAADQDGVTSPSRIRNLPGRAAAAQARTCMELAHCLVKKLVAENVLEADWYPTVVAFDAARGGGDPGGGGGGE